jgi:protein-S-isoprenylcysteine O-methyltransferase Ste14
MYAYTRHPVYGGLLLGAVGLAALTRSETRLALTALMWWVLERKVRPQCLNRLLPLIATCCVCGGELSC